MIALPNGALQGLQWWAELYPYDPIGAAVVPKRVCTVDVTTAHDDTPADTVYDGDLKVAYKFSSHLFASGKIGGRSDAGRGVLSLVNVADRSDGSGRFDLWPGLRWGRRRALISVGVMGGKRADAYTVRDCFTVDCVQPDPDTTQIPIASALELLNRPLSLPQFAGTGGAEGDGNWAGKYKPIVFGRRRRVPGLLVDTANNVHFVGLGPLQAVLGVFDGLGALTATADYASYALLVAAPLTAGHYATCLAAGLVRSFATPSNPLACDLQGYAGGGYVSSAAKIAESAMTGFLGISGAQYSATAIAAAHALQPAVCGAYVGTDGGNGLDLLDRTVGGAGFWFAEDRSGVITLGRLDLPTIVGPADANCAFVMGPDDMEPDGLQLLSQSEPPSQVQIRCQEWDQPPATNAAGQSQQWRIATGAVPGSVATEFPLATPLTIDSAFDDPADAAAEAARIATIEGAPRRIFSVKGFTDPFGIKLGQQGWIAHPREGLAAGQGVIAIGLDEDPDNCVSQLWGA